MPSFRRAYAPGGTFSFTVTTANRAAFLCDSAARDLLRSCIRNAREARPFSVDAIVLLPDHLHTMWTLLPEDSDFSARWAAIKGNSTRAWLRAGRAEQPIGAGQRRQRRRGVFQARFIEHTIRNEEDFARHLDYIHYNPVKHGLTDCPRNWPWSSFHRYVRLGVHPEDWGCAEPPPSLSHVNEGFLE
jgi:putative transposase